MHSARVTELFQPLELEQGLHLLDVMTWFPYSTADRWEKIAEYVALNAAVGTPPSPETCQEVTERILDAVPGVASVGNMSTGTAEDRWRDIPQAKWLYQVKYDLMRVLFPDDWFTFMNMGYADRDYILDDTLPPHQRVWQFAANLYSRVAGQIPLEGLDVLEVGCGRGGGAALVAKTTAPKSLTGLDYSPNNVAFCASVHTHPALQFLQGDAELLPFSDANFDAVLNIESAHCYPNVDKFFAEVYRVLKPGGHLLFADEWWTVNRAELAPRLSAVGFEVLAEEDITAGIIRALRLLETQADRLLGSLQDGPRKQAYERFFHKRVCQQSAYSYTSGRFAFVQVLARAEIR